MPRARRLIAEARDGWSLNRTAAPALLGEELDRAFDRIAENPNIGAPWPHRARAGLCSRVLVSSCCTACAHVRNASRCSPCGTVREVSPRRVCERHLGIGSCTGAPLACSDDACGGITGLQGRVTLAAGQHVVIVVDSVDPGDDGSYQLSITPP